MNIYVRNNVCDLRETLLLFYGKETLLLSIKFMIINRLFYGKETLLLLY